MINYFKSTLLLLCLFSLSLIAESCGSTQISNNIMFEANPPFTIKEAYFQKWVAGTKEGGAGTKVHLVFKSIGPEVALKEIYFQNQIQKVQKASNSGYDYFAEFDSNIRSNIIMDIDPMKEAQNTPSQNFPFELQENEAVVSYLFNDKTNYFKIINLSEKERIAYPQSNPNLRN